MNRKLSLQRELNKWIILSSLVLVLLGGVIAGGIAFFQARELQDNTLTNIANLVRTGKLQQLILDHQDSEEEESIIIQELGKQTYFSNIPSTVKDGLQTLVLDDEEWRVFTTTQQQSQRRFVIAQQTELRDMIAWSSSLAVFLPIALLVGILLILIHVIIRAQFLSLGKLTKVMDKQDGMHLAKINELSSKDVPIEIAPFVFSINALLSRVGQAMQKQQRFIADAAHELRTPIAALALQSENLAHATTEQDREERQHVLQQSLLRLRNLVAQLLDLARLQSEENVSIQEISFNMVVQDVSADMFPIAEAADIDLGMLRQDENIIVGDKQGRLGQLVRNAIENAIHFTPHGGKVDISLYKQDGKAVLIVEDSGKGIPEAELEQVMQLFYRVMEGVQPGSGLGLAISHEIAQRLGGSIILANREHGGLQFKYEQPLL